MYKDRDFDLAGFAVGVMEKDAALLSANVKKGDVVIGLSSSGFHSNGYSLVRKILDARGLDLNKDYGFGKLGGALMQPTYIYSKPLVEALSKFGGAIKGIAHITGGGIPGNLNRVLPDNLDANVKKGSWKIPPVVEFIVNEGDVDETERYKTFNMGIGMAVIASPGKAAEISGFIAEAGFANSVIGEVVEGSGVVNLL
jgi:phosphoribosylformylglycinamidine cyclo-ligase